MENVITLATKQFNWKMGESTAVENRGKVLYQLHQIRPSQKPILNYILKKKKTKNKETRDRVCP